MKNVPIFAMLAVLILLAAVNAERPKSAKHTPAKPAAPAAATLELVVYSDTATCEPCRRMEPIVKQFSQEHPAVRVRKGDNNDVATIPTFVAKIDGKEVARRTGVCTAAELNGLFRQPKQVLKTPAPEPAKPEKSVVVGKPVIGPDGWGLRLFYPPNDERGCGIAYTLGNMKIIGKQYGYEPVTTDSDRFAAWRRTCDVEPDRVELILFAPDKSLVLRDTNPPRTIPALRAKINEAAAKWEAKR